MPTSRADGAHKSEAIAVDADVIARAKSCVPLQALLRCANAPTHLRETAIAALSAGMRPEEVAAAVQIAPFLSLLHATALTGDLHDQPMSMTFANDIFPLIPPEPAAQRRLLRLVRIANICGGEATALALAKAMRADEAPRLGDFETAVTAMHHAVMARGDVPARRLALRRAQADTTLVAHARSGAAWFAWLLCETLFGADGIADTFRPDGVHQGLHCRALRTARDHLDAAERYNNCVGFMAPLLLRDVARIFEFSHDGQGHGLVELRMGGAKQAYLGINQMEGPQRTALSDQHEAAAFGLLASKPMPGSTGRTRKGGHAYPQSRDMTLRWKALLGPYLATHTVKEFFPSVISKPAMELMIANVVRMYQAIGLTSVVGELSAVRRVI